MSEDGPFNWENGGQGEVSVVVDPDRLRRRAVFLRDLAEAQALLNRVAPRRARAARLRARLRESTFRV